MATYTKEKDVETTFEDDFEARKAMQEVFSNTARWPLIIDPQLQGISWLRHKEGHASRNCQIVRLGQKDMMRKLERALESGAISAF